MDKPIKHSKSYYYYNELLEYLQEKSGRQFNDYYGACLRSRVTGIPNSDREFLCFWHWVCDNCNPQNGGFITFYREWLTSEEYDWTGEEWVKEIYAMFVDEFADENGEVEMMVSW